jgi:CelD/BcsL family acetyltransferase involved in cellulose biosynthesis
LSPVWEMGFTPNYPLKSCIAILKDSQAFRTLEEDWEDLYYDAQHSTPLQSWSWLYSWWEAFGENYELCLITVRNEGLLVGVIPLMLERWWGFRRLRFIGHWDKQSDILARKGWEAKVSEAGIWALRQINSWHVIHLSDVSPAAASWHIYQRWNARQTYCLANYYLFIEVKPWHELLTSLSSKHRNTVRQTLRRAEEDGVRSMLAGPAEVEQAACRLVAMHRKLRLGREIRWAHLTPEFESFIVAAARRMTDRGLGAISESWRDGEVFMSSFDLFGDKIIDGYLIGVIPEATKRYQWSSLKIYELLNMARSSNSTNVCLAQSGDPYKQRWPHKDVPFYRIILGRGVVLWRLYLTTLPLLERVKKYIPERVKRIIKQKSLSIEIKNPAHWLRHIRA